MSTPLQLRGVRATTDRDSRGVRGSGVHLYGVATWLKREPIVSAYITPAEARSLARMLLVAADAADGVI